MNRQRLEESARVVERHLGARPEACLVLGSGWGAAIADWPAETVVPYEAIPALGAPGVEGHAGRLLVLERRGRRLLVFAGRRHWYEGAGWDPVAFPVFLAVHLGIRTLVLTNAAGGIRDDLAPGDFMAVRDHVNAMGVNPLTGPHDPAWGPRFPDLSAVYDRALAAALDDAAREIGLVLSHGTYLAVSGPTYETPAEIRLFRQWGADAVGMSTVPEAILARAAGLRVAACSFISNRAAGTGAALAHADVLALAARAAPRMAGLLEALCGRLEPA